MSNLNFTNNNYEKNKKYNFLAENMKYLSQDNYNKVKSL